jgi:hypothetical protein
LTGSLGGRSTTAIRDAGSNPADYTEDAVELVTNSPAL